MDVRCQLYRRRQVHRPVHLQGQRQGKFLSLWIACFLITIMQKNMLWISEYDPNNLQYINWNQLINNYDAEYGL